MPVELNYIEAKIVRDLLDDWIDQTKSIIRNLREDNNDAGAELIERGCLGYGENLAKRIDAEWPDLAD